ncbi:hypothetical protein AQUCO_01000543v1 [Aquilegia coerulea]|uniref:DUF4408 domain-containing protein n=1 Tax=Aquilegia coerulea TaxID=218851 RepID=A0A2G5EAG1_AQUCA|nr:hypothetical protein AQUCO_01000543v1 [Aquilegia coerulea]
MDFSFDNVKREKANAMMRYRRVRKLANLFRLFEVVLALILVSWFTTQLPFIVEIFGNYFKKLCVVIISPRFVFVIGNAIIITLFLKSDQFSSKSSSNSSNEEVNLYEEFVKKNNENRQKICMEVSSFSSSPKEEIVFEDKETVCEVSSVPVPVPRDSPLRTPRTNKLRDAQRKSYRRTQSENIKRDEVLQKPEKKLRRSETEKYRTFGGKSSVGEKELSNEEFQRTIEAFIAKQAMFRWEESMAVVLHNQS